MATPFLAAAKSFADAGSELNDMSDRTGVSVEALSALGFAAAQTGTDMSNVEGGIRKMQKALVKGSQENLAAESTFAALGLSVEKLSNMSPEDQFSAVADAINNIQDPTAKAAAAMEIFGKSGTALLPMIGDLDALTSQAKQFGLVWSGDEAKKADALGDAIDLLTATMGRVVTSIGSALAPMLTELAGGLAMATKSVIDFIQANQPLVVLAFKVAVGIAAVGAGFVAVGAVIAGIGSTLAAVAAGLGAIGTVFAAIVSPIGILVIGLTALAAWFVTSTDAGTAAVSALGVGFMDLKDLAVTAFGGIADALKAGDIGLAGQILWAGLKVEWLKGIQFINGLMADWGVAIQEVFAPISTVVAGVFIDAWASIQSAFVKALDFMGVGFSDFVGTISQMWNNFSGFFSEVWARLKGLFTGGDVKAEVARIKDETAKANAEAAAAAASGPDNRGKLAQIEQTRVDSQAALVDQAAAGTDARRQAAADAVMAGASDLQAAQDELAGLVSQAGQGAADAASTAVAKAKGGPDLTAEAVDKTIEAAKQKVDVAGTFSASALQGISAGESVGEDQVKEQKTTNDHLSKLNKLVEKKQVAFA